MIRL
jgi:protein SERAC1